jgi:hypothetical protein
MRKQAEVKKHKLRVEPRPKRESLSREEELRRLRHNDGWRRAHFEEFKKTHLKVRYPY